MNAAESGADNAVLTAIAGARARTIAAAEAGCNQGDGEGCQTWADALAEGDAARAREIDQRACELARSTSCFRLARHFADGDGAGKDSARAVGFYQRSCMQLSDAASCVQLANVLWPTEPARAVDAWERACRLGDEHGCGSASRSYQRGEGVARNPARAAALQTDQCNLGNSVTCHMLAAATSGENAKRLYARACELSYQPSCQKLIDLLAAHRPLDAIRVDRLWARSAALLVRSCETGGNPDDCRDAAALFTSGRGVAKDPARAKALDARARAREDEMARQDAAEGR